MNIDNNFMDIDVLVSKEIKRPDYIGELGGISKKEKENYISGVIPVYTSDEIKKIRYANKIGREILDIAGNFVRSGITGNEINTIVHNACIERNAYPSPLGYFGFPKSVCVSVNEVICHGIPDQRIIEDGDIVNIDISVYVNGFHADMNETFMIGNVKEAHKNLVKTSYEALMAASDMIKPGTFYRDLGKAISKVANKSNCSVVKNYTGHGVGKLFHCLPIIPHYANNKAIGIMKPGHVFTIEPMINEGSGSEDWKDVLCADGWTVMTKSGKRSSQFEHTFLVTDTGFEILSEPFKKELVWSAERFTRL